MISLARTSDDLACAPQFFYAYFVLLKTGLSNRNLTYKGLKIELFLQKKQKIFTFFSENSIQSHKF